MSPSEKEVLKERIKKFLNGGVVNARWTGPSHLATTKTLHLEFPYEGTRTKEDLKISEALPHETAELLRDLLMTSEALLSQSAAVGKEHDEKDFEAGYKSGWLAGKDNRDPVEHSKKAIENWKEWLMEKHENVSALRAQAVPEGAIDGKKLLEWLNNGFDQCEKIEKQRHSRTAEDAKWTYGEVITAVESGRFSLSPEPETKEPK